ncbi:MAG: hypothetical protein ABFD08_00605 [Syntrophomonas sp.]
MSEEQTASNMKKFELESEYHQTLGVIDYLLNESTNEASSIVQKEVLIKLKDKLTANQNADMTPGELNTIILMLLDYVVKHLKSL